MFLRCVNVWLLCAPVTVSVKMVGRSGLIKDKNHIFDYRKGGGVRSQKISKPWFRNNTKSWLKKSIQWTNILVGFWGRWSSGDHTHSPPTQAQKLKWKLSIITKISHTQSINNHGLPNSTQDLIEIGQKWLNYRLTI